MHLSPHNLGDDLVECIGDMRRLRNLILVTNSYTECVASPVDYRVWKACRKVNPKLRVHLVTEGKHKKEITFQHRGAIQYDYFGPSICPSFGLKTGSRFVNSRKISPAYTASVSIE